MDEREPDDTGRPLTRRELRLREAAAAAAAAGQPATMEESAPAAPAARSRGGHAAPAVEVAPGSGGHVAPAADDAPAPDEHSEPVQPSQDEVPVATESVAIEPVADDPVVEADPADVSVVEPAAPDGIGAVAERSMAPQEADATRWRALTAWSLHHELPAALPEEADDDDVHWHVDLGSTHAASDDVADGGHEDGAERDESDESAPAEPPPDETLGAEGTDEVSFEDIVMPPSIPPRGAVPRRRSVLHADDETADDRPSETLPPQWTPVSAGGIENENEEVVDGAASTAQDDLFNLLPPIPEPDGSGELAAAGASAGWSGYVDEQADADVLEPYQPVEYVGADLPVEPDLPVEDVELFEPDGEDVEPVASRPSEAVPPALAVPVPPKEERHRGDPLPTLSDLLAARPTPPAGPAQLGWQGALRRITGGLLPFRPGSAEREQRAEIGMVQRHLDGPRTIVVINPKGGAHKTTGTLLLAAAFGQHRGGYTLAWDNNETRGTLGWRSLPGTHQRTAVDLLQDLDRFTEPGAARVGDLDGYVRSQGSAQFDVLASDEDAASAASIDGFAFRSLHRTLSRFYRVMVVDTGNNMRASNWQAAIDAADQVVIVSTVREDTAQSAAWAIDALRATGHAEAVRNAVTVLSDPGPQRDAELVARLHEHFGRLTRAVVDVPYDASLVGGSPLQVEQLDRRTREAWLRVAAVVAEGL